MGLLSPIEGMAQSQLTETTRGKAWGKVLLAADERPIRHARVELLIPTTGWNASALTDSKGEFQFVGLSPATYQVTVIEPAHVKLYATVRVCGSTGPLLFRLRKAEQAATPRNNSVVTIQELKSPEKAEAAFEKGTRLLQKGNLQESLSYFQRATEKDPEYYRAYHNSGLAHYQLGEIEQAEADFQKSIELTNGGYAPSEFALGALFLEKQDLRQAERLIQSGLEMEPGSSLGKYLLGLVQFSMNHLDEAEKSAHEALWRSPRQADAHILLARIHAREHSPYAVVADVTEYIKADPGGYLQEEGSKLLEQAQTEINQYVVAIH